MSEGPSSLPSALPQVPPPPSLNHVLGEMRREGEVGWPGLAHGGTGTVPPAWPPPDVCLPPPLFEASLIPPFKIKSVKKRMSCDGATEGDISRANGELLLKDAKNCVCVDPQCIIEGGGGKKKKFPHHTPHSHHHGLSVEFA